MERDDFNKAVRRLENAAVASALRVDEERSYHALNTQYLKNQIVRERRRNLVSLAVTSLAILAASAFIYFAAGVQ